MNLFQEITLSSWNQIHQVEELLPGFVYRGQSDSSWNLTSSLERAIDKYHKTNTRLEYTEQGIIRGFKEKFHLYSNDAPDPSNSFEWLALLQHYGCLTRLLDFSKSIYIASFFALAEAIGEASIWAISTYNINKNLKKHFKLKYNEIDSELMNHSHVNLLNKYIGNAEQYKAKGNASFVVPIEPTRHSLRSSNQQGLFLAPLIISNNDKNIPFIDNLKSSFVGSQPIGFRKVLLKDFIEEQDTPYVTDLEILKINLPKNIQPSARNALEIMNITDESLFTGLDGLAKSMILRKIRTKV